MCHIHVRAHVLNCDVVPARYTLHRWQDGWQNNVIYCLLWSPCQVCFLNLFYILCCSLELHIQRDSTAITLMWLSKVSHILCLLFIIVTKQTLWSRSRNLSHSWGLALSAGKQPSQQLYNKLLWCPLICSSSRVSPLWICLSVLQLFGLQSLHYISL